MIDSPNALGIFAASFIVVSALGVQQLNVNTDRRVLAFLTSLVIGAATLVQFKVLPGPTSWLDIAGYLLGSALGIVTSMWAYPRVFKRRLLANAGLPTPSASAVKLGETLRLSLTIADYAAQADIESFCRQVQTPDQTTWWDTEHTTDATDAIELQYIANAAGYLNLRAKLIVHPKLPHLVRFTR